MLPTSSIHRSDRYLLLLTKNQHHYVCSSRSLLWVPSSDSSAVVSVCSSHPPVRSLFIAFSDTFSIVFSGILSLLASSSFSAIPDLRSARSIDNLHRERRFSRDYSARFVPTIRIAPTAKIHS
ncbi:unnamed protein product [Citrullus colocynthis]|uniref:Uncharacterized protein n=1 Tax=Citrullus colocynthis TaxID=252529 RepID=A0ABP0XTB0_9ROSI